MNWLQTIQYQLGGDIYKQYAEMVFRGNTRLRIAERERVLRSLTMRRNTMQFVDFVKIEKVCTKQTKSREDES